MPELLRQGQELLGLLVLLVVPIFVAMDPLGTLPLILAWTSDLTPAERDSQLLTAVVLRLLDGLGLGVPDFLVAGGLVLLVLAAEMAGHNEDVRPTRTYHSRLGPTPCPAATSFLGGARAGMITSSAVSTGTSIPSSGPRLRRPEREWSNLPSGHRLTSAGYPPATVVPRSRRPRRTRVGGPPCFHWLTTASRTI